MSEHRDDVIGLLARHPVASNLIMLIMVAAGIFALLKLNTQFFPTFQLQYVRVHVAWTGATAEDMETSVASLLEEELRNVDQLRELTSTSTNGSTTVLLEFDDSTEMGPALDEVVEKVGQVRQRLPEAAEEPIVARIVRRDTVASVLVYGPDSLDELRALGERFERELLAAGIAQIDMDGLPDEQIAIEIPSRRLHDLDLTLEQVAQRVAAESQDIPAGTVGRADVARLLRALDQRRDAAAFYDIPVVAGTEGQWLRLGELADIRREARDNQLWLTYQGKPAIELTALRDLTADTFKSAEIFNTWVDKTRQELPAGVELKVYQEQWKLVQERMDILVKNGLGGLVLVISILYLFLNGRVAIWVAIGIPVSFMATLAVYFALGGSINMISMFALIMALGIIVDDAIVVGEYALSDYERGSSPLAAAEHGARQMFAPVLSSSLTTIAAFIPLLIVGGIIGQIMSAIPMVIICVVIASLWECFLVLPGHLRHSFSRMEGQKTPRWRQRFDAAFDRFREGWFRARVTAAIRSPGVTLTVMFSTLVLGLALLGTGHVKGTFFASPDNPLLFANISFSAGTPVEQVEAMLSDVERTGMEALEEFGPNHLKAVVSYRRVTLQPDMRLGRIGDEHAFVMLELSSIDQRDFSNAEFIEAWQRRIPKPAGLENLAIFGPKAGPPGQDIEVSLSGASIEQLKAAAERLKLALAAYPGVSGVSDDAPFGAEQLIFSLNDQGRTQGLTVADIGRQVRSAYDGFLAQSFQRDGNEIQVRVRLPEVERNQLANLQSLPIRLRSGESAPLGELVSLSSRRGFETLRRRDAQLAVKVAATVDKAQANANEIVQALESGILAELAVEYGLQFSYDGQLSDQAETQGDMKIGVFYALALIYLVLAWVFGSYGWPILVMMIIPFGLVGALVGHWVLGLDFSMLSAMGFFALSGIVVNDSIILVVVYRELRKAGMPLEDALPEASVRRLRAVLLTSLTTIAGLTPLLFETALSAQFLIPMAASISFGLLYATVIVLVLIPTLLGVYERVVAYFGATPRYMKEIKVA